MACNSRPHRTAKVDFDKTENEWIEWAAFTNSVPAEVDYLTADKRYFVGLTDGEGFYIVDDLGERIYCLWEGCSHLNGEKWHREPVPAQARGEAL